MRTAKTRSERALIRSGVALRNTTSYSLSYIDTHSVSCGTRSSIRLPSASGYGADCVSDNVYDSHWSADARYMVDGMRRYLRLHALRHVALGLRDDHPIAFCK